MKQEEKHILVGLTSANYSGTAFAHFFKEECFSIFFLSISIEKMSLVHHKIIVCEKIFVIVLLFRSTMNILNQMVNRTTNQT